MRHPTVSSLAEFLVKAGTQAAAETEAKDKKLDHRMARQRKAFGRKRKRRGGAYGGEAR
jgi:hypothetical protein